MGQLVIKTLEWGNCFSYGPHNTLNLSDSKITQLVGKNGHGKSSIALILEEVLFNKNNKSIKKADIPNRYLGSSYWIKLYFTAGDSDFLIDLERKSSLKVKLFKDGVDISSHTGTATFNTIKDVLGVDFKVFSQLFYQSSTVGLMFLTATDANRKKFLIDLFSLNEYLEYHEKYKALHKEISLELGKLQGSEDTLAEWLLKNKNPGPIKPITAVEVPSSDALQEAKNTLSSIRATNKRIQDNNTLKDMLADISFDKSLIEESTVDISKNQKQLGMAQSEYQREKEALYRAESKKIPAFDIELLNTDKIGTQELKELIRQYEDIIMLTSTQIKNLEGLRSECPTCTQQVSQQFLITKIAELKHTREANKDKLSELNQKLTEAQQFNASILEAKKNSEHKEAVEAEIIRLTENLAALESDIKEHEATINKHKSRNDSIAKAKFNYREWQSIYARIDRSLPSGIVIEEEVQAELKVLEQEYKDSVARHKKAQEENNQASAHNARVSVYKENSDRYSKQLEEVRSKLEEFKGRAENLDTLKKAFSTNGLVAYKLENLVKDLEVLTNEYLLELSDGRFALEFNLEKDKLNIVIIDNGNLITITALSAGELARVNAATLLAIRKLMNSISKTQINILFLDEIINVLDDDGKEKLVEVLLEEDLNTFLVSHGWTHPMLDKIHIVKEDDVSRLE